MKTVSLGLLLLLAPVAASMAQSVPAQVYGQCPAGTTLLSYAAAVAQRNALCDRLGAWTISRLADGGSMDGRGYQCQVRARDDRSLGHSICTPATQTAAGADHRHMLAQFERESAENASPTAFAINPNIVHLVQGDRVSGNLLFRGNMPVAHGVFQYDALVQAMRAAAQAAGQALPSRFRVIDISLVNDWTDKKALAVEKAYWANHPTQGQFIHNAIYGSVTSPNDYPVSERKDIERQPTLGDLGALIDRIHALLSTPSADGIPVLLYVHCEAGKDRTGEVIGAYAMKYMATSYKAALANANAVAGREISVFNQNELQWHAYFLADYEGIKTIGPID